MPRVNQIVLGCIVMVICTACWCAALPYARDAGTSASLAGRWHVHGAQGAQADQWADAVDDSGWPLLDVPANWYAAGLDHQGALWYRTRFARAAADEDTMTTLVFEGIDYYADVWLNGACLGFHEGYFEPFAFDVSSLLRAGANQLSVRVDSPYEMPGSEWSLHKRLIKGVLDHHDTRPGGAWSEHGQDANSGGIWAPVYLHTSRGAAIDVLEVSTSIADGGASAIVSIDAGVRNRAAENATLSIRVAPANFSGRSYDYQTPVILNAGTNHLSARFSIAEPALWWPAGHGFPSLYSVTARLSDAHGEMDSAMRRTGVRSVVFDAADSAWKINGRRLFLRGTNYIGSPWLSQMTAATYARDLDLMLAAHINAVRVHAHVEGQALYDMADERGLLLWQDFPLQWGYDDSAAFAEQAAEQARAMLSWLGSHPSIIAWSAQNEPPWDADWMKYRYPDWRPDLNVQLTRDVAQALRTDTTRYVQAASSSSQHYWQGWYWGKWTDFSRPAQEANISEFGAQALPDAATLRTIVSPANLWPSSNAAGDPKWAEWEYHDFQRKETFENAGVERGPTLETFIRNSQHYQARLIQLAAESLRRQRYQPVASLFQFMFVEGWPSISWGVLDYRRHPKEGYAALARAYQPVLPSIAWTHEIYAPGDTLDATVWALNDTWQEYPGAHLEWRVLQGGKSLAAGSIVFDMSPDSGRPLTDVRVRQLTAGSHMIEAVIRAADGHVLGSNEFEFDVRDRQP